MADGLMDRPESIDDGLGEYEYKDRGQRKYEIPNSISLQGSILNIKAQVFYLAKSNAHEERTERSCKKIT
jgi:hypothetical protein